MFPSRPTPAARRPERAPALALLQTLVLTVVSACVSAVPDLPRDGGPGKEPMTDAGLGADAGHDDDAGAATPPGLDGGQAGDAGRGESDADASVADAGWDLDASADVDAGGGGSTPDGGVLAGSRPTQPAEVLRQGTAGLLLRGTVLTLDGPIERGEVLIAGKTITCVATDCGTSAGAATATIIETHGVISPGLIDSHNHLAYDFLDEWVPARLYGDRYEWADEASYEAWVAPYADNRSAGAVFCPAAKWGELRAITHGTTTMQGQAFQQSCINGLMRNAEHYDGFAGDQLATNIGSVRDINDSTAASLVARFTAMSNPVQRYAVHMAEGIDEPATLEFDSFAGRDSRANRHMGTSLLAGPGYSGVAVLIHSVPMDPTQLAEAADAEAKLVWSPSSNMALYGETADIETSLSLGLTVAIGPDWTPSGEDDMLAELRYARAYGRERGIEALTPRKLWEMATSDGADVVGLSPAIGRIAVGSRADILVIGREGSDPYDALIDADVRDVRLVLVDGAAYFGDANLESASAVNTDCDDLDACGGAKFVCAKGVPATGPSTTTSRTTETVADIEAQLVSRLATYGRDDLLPLAHECR